MIIEQQDLQKKIKTIHDQPIAYLLLFIAWAKYSLKMTTEHPIEAKCVAHPKERLKKPAFIPCFYVFEVVTW